MNYNWNTIIWFFRFNRPFRSIFNQDTSLNDWEKSIDLLNPEYEPYYNKKTNENYA